MQGFNPSPFFNLADAYFSLGLIDIIDIKDDLALYADSFLVNCCEPFKYYKNGDSIILYSI